MKKSLYICNATNPAMGNTHTTNTAKYSVFSGVTSVIRCGFVAKLIQGVRSLFVHTNAKLVTQMRQTDKQATKAKNSNLSANTIDILVALGAIITATLLIIFVPDVALAIGKFIGCLVLVAMAVVPMLHALKVFYNER
jgi:hypothetical protein